MRYIVNALRYTYYNEIRAYSGLSFLVDILEEELNHKGDIDCIEVVEIIKDIQESLEAIKGDKQ